MTIRWGMQENQGNAGVAVPTSKPSTGVLDTQPAAGLKKPPSLAMTELEREREQEARDFLSSLTSMAPTNTEPPSRIFSCLFIKLRFYFTTSFSHLSHPEMEATSQGRRKQLKT